DLGLLDVEINVKQGLKIKDYESVLNQSKRDNQLTAENNQLRSDLDKSKIQIDSLSMIPSMGDMLLREIKALVPSIESCSYALSKKYDSVSDTPVTVTMVYFSSQEKILEEDQLKIRNWLENRLQTKSIILK